MMDINEEHSAPAIREEVAAAVREREQVMEDFKTEDKAGTPDDGTVSAKASVDVHDGQLGSDAAPLTYELLWKDGSTEYINAALIVGPGGELCFWHWSRGVRTVQLVVSGSAYERCRITRPL